MRRLNSSCCSLLLVLGTLCCVLGSRAAASDKFTNPPGLHLGIGESTQLLGDVTGLPRYTLLTAILRPPHSAHPPLPRNLRLEVTPFLDELVNFVRDAGIPVRAIRGSSAGRPLGISASFKVHEDMPAITLYARERSPELFGAFYPVRSGVSWAFVWPVQRFTLRLQGGNDSEFGYFAIGGVEWRHPAQPLAVGIGVPMNLHNANGNVGALFLFRMKFD